MSAVITTAHVFSTFTGTPVLSLPADGYTILVSEPQQIGQRQLTAMSPDVAGAALLQSVDDVSEYHLNILCQGASQSATQTLVDAIRNAACHQSEWKLSVTIDDLTRIYACWPATFSAPTSTPLLWEKMREVDLVIPVQPATV